MSEPKLFWKCVVREFQLKMHRGWCEEGVVGGGPFALLSTTCRIQPGEIVSVLLSLTSHVLFHLSNTTENVFTVT